VLLKCNLITLELQHIEINISSRAKVVQLAKTKAITHLLPTLQTSWAAILVTQRKSLKIQMCPIPKRGALSS